MSAADQIRIEQEKLDRIRRETEKEEQEFIAEMRGKLRAQKEAGRDGGLDRDAQREALREAQKRTDDFKDRIQRQQDQEKRDRQQKADQAKTDEQKQSDQRKADQAKKDDQQKEDLRAAARSKAREETEKLVKEGLEKHVQERQERIMSGALAGPPMTPGMDDPLKMAAAMDHPGLTDTEKALAATAGWAVGQGWHEREAERKQALMQGERGKLDGDKAHAPEKTEPEKEKEEEKQHHEPEKTPEARADQAVKDRDNAVSDVKENARKDHEDQQVVETGKDIQDRAKLESTGKVSARDAEAMTHGKGSKEKEDRKFEEWYSKNETQELEEAGVSRDAHDYEIEDER